MISRKVIEQPKKRLASELQEKAERIGNLLGLDKVPVHTLAWKEIRLQLSTGDCYPLYDVLEKIAEDIAAMMGPRPKKPGRPPKDK